MSTTSSTREVKFADDNSSNTSHTGRQCKSSSLSQAQQRNSVTLSTISSTRGVTIDDGNSSSSSKQSPNRCRVSCCCFRYGWYPCLLAAIITAACLLDLYSSMSCEFLQVSVKTDDGSDRGSAFIGIYLRQTGAFESGTFGEYLAEGCQPYSSLFVQNVIQEDRVWQATRYLGIISILSGGAAAILCWIFVVTPIPLGCLWRGLLLPLLLIAFLAEGLKFLFLDVNICNAPLWYTSSNRTACELGTTAYFAIAAGVVFFVCPILICCYKPPFREIASSGRTQFSSRLDKATQEEEDDEESDSSIGNTTDDASGGVENNGETEQARESATGTAAKKDPEGELLSLQPMIRIPIDP